MTTLYRIISPDNQYVLRTSDNSSIPPDVENMDYVGYLAWVAEGNTPDPYVAPPAPPLTATPLQFRLGLSQAGLRTAVEAWIPTASQATQDAFQYASIFVENDPLVSSAAAQFSLSTAQVHALFITMQTLSP